MDRERAEPTNDQQTEVLENNYLTDILEETDDFRTILDEFTGK